MSELLSRMDGGQLLGLVAIVGGLLLMAATAIAGIWAGVRHADFQARQAEAETALKQDMISRGMSVDDIERVLTASSAGVKKESDYKRGCLKG